MPHPIIEIDELLRLIIDELVEASPRTAVSFALTCRSLEEPTLSSLWRKQRSLYFLLEVLPGCALAEGEHGFDDTVSGRDFTVYHTRCQSPPDDRALSFSGGLGQVATVRFLDA